MPEEQERKPEQPGFDLEIISPEKRFFAGRVESLQLPGDEGMIGILRNHIPMVCSLVIGTIIFKQKGRWRHAFASEGFVTVRPDKTVVFVQAVEWPEDIDDKRAQEAAMQAQDNLSRQMSRREFTASRASLVRALTRLRVRQNYRGDI